MKFHTALGILKLLKWMRSNACSWTMVTSKLLWDWPKHPRSIGERDVGDRENWRGCRESEVKGGEYIRYIFRVWRRGASLVYQNFWVWSILWCSTWDIFGYFTSRIPRIRGITISDHRAWWKALGLMSQAALPLSRILAKPGRLNGEIQDWDGWMATSDIQQFGLGRRVLMLCAQQLV